VRPAAAQRWRLAGASPHGLPRPATAALLRGGSVAGLATGLGAKTASFSTREGASIAGLATVAGRRATAAPGKIAAAACCASITTAVASITTAAAEASAAAEAPSAAKPASTATKATAEASAAISATATRESAAAAAAAAAAALADVIEAALIAAFADALFPVKAHSPPLAAKPASAATKATTEASAAISAIAISASATCEASAAAALAVVCEAALIATFADPLFPVKAHSPPLAAKTAIKPTTDASATISTATTLGGHPVDRDSALDLLRALLVLHFVKDSHKGDRGTIFESIPVLDARKVAEEVVAPVVRLDEAEPPISPARRRAALTLHYGLRH